MLIDLTRKPLIVFPEECPLSVVVRSVGNKTVAGIVAIKTSRRGHVTLTPDASLKRGESTCYETRLPLPGHRLKGSSFTVEDGPPLGGIPVTRITPIGRIDPHFGSKRPEVKILPEPFEVASAYKDMLTEAGGTWRIAVRIEHLTDKLKKSPWAISVIDATTGTILATVAVSGLDPNPLILHDVLPLKRALDRTTAPGNAWTRILESDSDEE